MFETLLSNKRMKDELGSAIANDRPMQAYMFCGPEGSGKMTAALGFAKELVGTGSSKVDRGSHPDVIVIAPENGKKTVSVDVIREMRFDAFINPSEGRRKIYIIDKAHSLNEHGQNALLTILEQPPSFAVFILLSDSKEKMLSTIVSRCAVFEMEYVDPKEGALFLNTKHPDISKERFLQAMQASGGNIGLAYKLAASSDFEEYKKLSERIMRAVLQNDEYTAASIMSKLTKDNAVPFLSVLCMYIKDILVLNTSKNSDSLVFKDSILQNAAEFGTIDINVLYDSIQAVSEAIADIEASISTPLATAAVVIQLFGGKKVD